MFAASNTCVSDIIKTVGANSSWFYSKDNFFVKFLNSFLDSILFGVKTSGERSKKYLDKACAYRLQRK